MRSACYTTWSSALQTIARPCVKSRLPAAVTQKTCVYVEDYYLCYMRLYCEICARFPLSYPVTYTVLLFNTRMHKRLLVCSCCWYD